MSGDLTPMQYHYPHFLDIARLNADLRPWHVQAVVQNSETPDSEHLAIKHRDPLSGDLATKPFLVFGPGTFLMVQASRLYAWQKYTNGLLIRQYALDQENIPASLQEDFIDIEKVAPGIHQRKPAVHFDHFVTFIRKPNLVTQEDWYEKYVIVHLHQDRIQIVPLDMLNETGGDPMYVWPALASWSPTKGILYGHGMRMGSFEVSMMM